MFQRLLPLLAAFALAAPLAAQPPSEPPLDPACPQSDLNAPRGPGIVCLGKLDEAVAFSVVYPRAIEQMPDLADALRGEWRTALDWIEARAREHRAERAAEDSEPQRLSYEAAWRIDADTPEIVAASGTISHYTGGAHGGIEYKTVLIDRRSGRRIGFTDLFAPGFFGTTLLGQRLWGVRTAQQAFCTALTAEVRERRGDPAAAVHCPAVETQPVTLICGASGRIETMRVLLNPYVVGAWAEGPYEIDFAVDAAMMSVIWRRLRPAFGLAREARARVPARPCR
jgi:hypothetical protein